MRKLKFKQNTFLQVLNQKLKKWQKHPDFRKSEAYAKLTVGLRLFYDYLLITQMLKFGQKRDMKHPDFREKRVLFEFYSSSIRVLCVLTSSLLHGY